MVALPAESKTEQAIYAIYEKRNSPPRPYLGGSQIGDSCERKLWLGFRWCADRLIEGRIMRLFETGHLEEPRVVADLRAIGCTVFDLDPETGEQFRFVAHGGHYSGGLDGVVKGVLEAPRTPHLLEIKTHNDRSFKALVKDGVQKSKPLHYAQCQTYMGGMKLKRTLYVAKNKNTDELYVERIEYVPATAKALEKKALRIIEAKTPPTKPNRDASYFECKWCAFSGLCHEQKVADVNCRTCVHATPELDGNQRWSCAKYDCDIPEANQRTGCESHLHIPELVPYAEPIDADGDWVRYRLEDGREFIECSDDGFPGADVPHYSSREIAAIDPAAIGHPVVDSARRILEGTVVG
ncbi:MAG: oxidoreductase [Planctomycetota bacterium]|jgi:hypothetical protein